MKISLKLFMNQKRQELGRMWYKITRPLASYLTKRDNSRYHRIKDSIIEDKAIKWFSESIINYIVKYLEPDEAFLLVIAKWINPEHHSGYYCIGDYGFKYLLTKQKHRIAHYKFNRDFQFQEKVVDKLRNTKGILVEEVIETFDYLEPNGYQKTYYITLAK